MSFDLAELVFATHTQEERDRCLRALISASAEAIYTRKGLGLELTLMGLEHDSLFRRYPELAKQLHDAEEKAQAAPTQEQVFATDDGAPQKDEA